MFVIWDSQMQPEGITLYQPVLNETDAGELIQHILNQQHKDMKQGKHGKLRRVSHMPHI